MYACPASAGPWEVRLKRTSRSTWADTHSLKADMSNEIRDGCARTRRPEGCIRSPAPAGRCRTTCKPDAPGPSHAQQFVPISERKILRAPTCLANRFARVRIGLLRAGLPDRMAARVPADLWRLHRGVGGGARDLHRRPGRRRLAAGIACGSPPASDPAVRATRSHRGAVGGRQPAAALPGPHAVHRRRRHATPGPGRRHGRPAGVERAGARAADGGNGRNAAGRRRRRDAAIGRRAARRRASSTA